MHDCQPRSVTDPILSATPVAREAQVFDGGAMRGATLVALVV